MPERITHVQGVVRIAYDDATGRHDIGEPVMLPAGTPQEVEDLRRLVDYKVVDAIVPDAASSIFIPDPGPPPPIAENPAPPPPIPLLIEPPSEG